ncbi:MAG TPA: NUDIX domain-containing protein [Polyangiaceae bacterium]|nr:NUDIX domain-containing protein [Polyangiaceae bacterium]
MNPSIICTVDVVLLTLHQNALHVALVRREREPYANAYALPGGYIHAQEDADAEEAATRVLRTKAGIASPYLEQLGTFSGRGRDPRGWSISVSYYALVPESVFGGERPADLKLVPVDRARGLPFDHQYVIETAVARVRSKSSYSSLPVYLCSEPFTLPRLQAVYEALLGEPINKVSFRRKMEELDMLEPVQGAQETGRANRPAQLYRLKARFKRQLSTTTRALNPD